MLVSLQDLMVLFLPCHHLLRSNPACLFPVVLPASGTSMWENRRISTVGEEQCDKPDSYAKLSICIHGS